jgi:hypothetical protein
MIIAVLILTHILAAILGVMLYTHTHTQFQDLSRTEILKVTQIIENMKVGTVKEYNTLITEWQSALVHGKVEVTQLSIPLQSIITQVKRA